MKTKILLVLLLIVGIALVVLYRDHFDVEILQSWVESAGVLAPLLFMLIYIIGTVLFLPGSVLTLAGGALFGPFWGTFYNLTAATMGAGLTFLISRHLASQSVETWVKKKAEGKAKRLKEGVEKEGWRFVVFARLVPVFPFNLLNYALGLTRLKFSHYLIASYLAMLPGAAAYTYLGYIGREAAAGSEGLIQKALLAIALLAITAFIPRFYRRYARGDVQDLEAEEK
ncbi:MAG: TVP38/TMEM64 family protein [bacterium]